MSGLVKHKITVRHVRESHPSIKSTYPPKKIAEKLFYEADEYGFNEIISVTVDGFEYYSIEETR